MSHSRSRLPRRLLIGLLLVVAVLGVGIAWALVPRSLGPVTVEAAGRAESGIAVTFTVPRDLAEERARLGLGYVAARLAACDHPDAAATQVVAQRAGYLADRGRVRRIGADGGRVRYRAVFDNALTETIDHQARRTPAMGRPGGLCFSLYGASMWFGQARSAAVPIGF